MTQLRYLAYGSNLWPQRLLERVPCQFERVVSLRGFRLTFSKIGADGSGKCDLVPSGQHCAWGALYRIPFDGRDALDRAEGPDYAVRTLELESDRGSVECFYYQARVDRTDPDMVPFSWYRELVLHGARHHAFPADYVEQIRAVPTRPDPDPVRHRLHMALLDR